MRRLTLKGRIASGLMGLGATAIVVCSGGCGLALLGLVQAAEEIPAELAAVLDDSATFLVDPNEPLEPIDGGTPVLGIAELDGCWGSSWQTATRLPNRTTEVSQVLKFDAASGRLERFTYQSLVIVAPVVMVERGTFLLDAAGLGTFEVIQELSTVRTGKLVDDTDRFETLPVYEVQLAWDGDELLARFGEIDTPRTSGGFADRVTLRHRQFICP
jgi:hypothetical protein